MVIYLDSIDQSGTDYTVRGINPIKQCGASVIKDKVKTADTIMLQKTLITTYHTSKACNYVYLIAYENPAAIFDLNSSRESQNAIA
jgi:hypothetical protein